MNSECASLVVGGQRDGSAWLARVRTPEEDFRDEYGGWERYSRNGKLFPVVVKVVLDSGDLCTSRLARQGMRFLDELHTICPRAGTSSASPAHYLPNRKPLSGLARDSITYIQTRFTSNSPTPPYALRVTPTLCHYLHCPP